MSNGEKNKGILIFSQKYRRKWLYLVQYNNLQA